MIDEGREEEIFVANGEFSVVVAERRRMKIVTYNVNGIKQRISQHGGSLLKLLNSLDADIICFQETKLSRDEITADLIMAEGYESFFSCTSTSGRGRTGYSGVATFCRVKSAFSSKEVALPIAAEEGFTGLLEHTTRGNSMKKDYLLQVSVKVELEGITKEEMLRVDSEGRCIITDHGHFVLFNLYGPRAGGDDEERVQFKLTFFKILQKRWEALLSQGKRVIVVGDLNIAPAAIDRCDADPKFEENQFRKWLRSLLVEQGGPFFDVFRSKHPERKAYTCWAVHNGAEQFNYGSRIDHILIAGPCLHQDHDMQGHNIIECHVNECDIMTQFKRWKPENNNSISRWKGGRSIKLEGSDHVPVFASLLDIPDLQEHNTPSLAARYVPKIHGLQQTIVTFFSKRQLAAEVKNPAEPLLADGNDTEKSCDDSFDRSLHYCSVSGSPSVASSSNQECEDFSPSSNEQLSTQMNPAAEESTVIMLRKETTKSLLPCHMKTNKKARIGSSSQRTLQSYFQKKPSPIVANYSASAKSQISLGKDHNLNGEDDSTLLPNELTSPKGTPDVSDGNNDLHKNEFNTSPSDLSRCDVNTCSSTAKDTYNVAMSEWQRIQQLMHKHKTVPLCKGHAEPCIARMVKKTGPTFGRKFYVCCRAEGPSSNPETNCGYFEWADSKSGKKRK